MAVFNVPGARGQTVVYSDDADAGIVSWLFNIPGARGFTPKIAVPSDIPSSYSRQTSISNDGICYAI